MSGFGPHAGSPHHSGAQATIAHAGSSSARRPNTLATEYWNGVNTWTCAGAQWNIVRAYEFSLHVSQSVNGSEAANVTTHASIARGAVARPRSRLHPATNPKPNHNGGITLPLEPDARNATAPRSTQRFGERSVAAKCSRRSSKRPIRAVNPIAVLGLRYKPAARYECVRQSSPT